MSADLFDAIVAHDVDRLAALLTSGADPNVPRGTWPRWTPLQAAVEEADAGGPIEPVMLLLRNGADPNGWDSDHEATALLMSVLRGHVEATRLLLVAGGDPNVTGAEGDTALRWSVDHGDYASAATLLRCNASHTIDSFGGPSGMSALGKAVSRLDVRMVELLLGAGANATALDANRQVARQHLPSRTAENDAEYDETVQMLASRGG